MRTELGKRIDESRVQIEKLALPYQIKWKPDGFDDIMTVYRKGNPVYWADVRVGDEDYFLPIDDFDKYIMRPAKSALEARMPSQ